MKPNIEKQTKVGGGLAREFDFRVWARFENGKYYMLDFDNIEDWQLISVFRDQEYDECTMQFTGLFDKNDVKIFEGDFVRLTPENWPDEDWDIVMWVKFINGVFQFNDGSPVGEFFNSDMEVIGNICENPELLKQ